ncbi:MAG: hypothetical protein EA401_07205 [Planctomycetota bacterium]|nr:MAG: hypothetical protein EA401_07205 [Planctomycetota bacterium]
MHAFNAKSALVRSFLQADQEIGDPGGELCAALLLSTGRLKARHAERGENGTQQHSVQDVGGRDCIGWFIFYGAAPLQQV